MDELKKAVIQEESERYKKLFDEIKTEEGIKKVLAWENKKYINNVERKTRRYLEKRKEKSIKEKLSKIEAAEKSENFRGPLIVTIEWKKSRMWGSNPKAYTNFGFISESIGGCGYDKESTALAEALNSHLPLMKMLYASKNNNLRKWQKQNPDKDLKNDFNRDFLGYGSGYGIVPYFEGGVGTNSHREIIKRLGLVFEQVTDTPKTSVYIIRKWN
jgi:hypothetical protein